MRYIGIDIGLSGAIAFVDTDGGYRTFDMPIYIVTKGKAIRRKIDEQGLVEIIKDITLCMPNLIAYVEQQQAYHKQGVVSTFSLAYQFGFVKGVLQALGIRHETVMPQRWQKEFNIVRSKDTKNASYEKVSSLFPKATTKTKRGRIKDGNCDALLIAEYCRRCHTGKRDRLFIDK